MKLLLDNRGIALVTSLMLTMITLVISLIMLYMVSQHTQMSGAQKRYKNSLDAAVGGVEIVTKDALPSLVRFATEYSGTANYFTNNITSVLTGGNLSLSILGDSSANSNDQQCLTEKLISRTGSWAHCSAARTNTDARDTPDFTFTLQSQLPGAPVGFIVRTKIVSTTPGNTDMSGRVLDGSSVSGAPTSADIGAPYLYRIEVNSERASNPQERSNLSLLYAY